MSPDPFGDMNANRDRSAQVASQAAQFEETLVKHMLARLKLSEFKSELLGIWHSQHGEYRLKFASLNFKFPTFPFVLGSGRFEGDPVHKDRKSTEPARFKSFASVPFVEMFREFKEQVDAEAGWRNVGLIFPRKGFRYGMIIHDNEEESYWQQGLSWVYKDVKGDRTYVQPFTAVLDSIYDNGRGWRPNE